MNNSDLFGVPALITAFIIGLMFLGFKFGQINIREQAITAGVAHWTVNPTNGQTKFEWNKL